MRNLLKRLALRRYALKVKNDPCYYHWLQTHKNISEHWGHYDEKRDLDLAHLKSQLYEIYQMILRRRREPNRVLDAGASDGLFLSAMNGLESFGLNINISCVLTIQRDGFQSCLGSVEAIPWKDNHFDAVICTETLEHVVSPIRCLTELSRVCSGTIFVTIPMVKRTRVLPKNKVQPEGEGHIIEFCPEDFKKLLTYTDLEIAHEDRLQIFPSRNPILRAYMERNFHTELQYYELRHRK